MSRLLTIITAALVLLAITIPAIADGQETCPSGDGWVKFDDLGGTTFTIPNIPDGYQVTASCYKASTTVVFGSGPTVTSTVLNQNGQVQELSHASFLLERIVPIVDVTIEGYCRVDSEGVANALFDAAFLTGSGIWTVNGNVYGPMPSGQPALFGENTYQADADTGEQFSGTFNVPDCTEDDEFAGVPTTTTIPTVVLPDVVDAPGIIEELPTVIISATTITAAPSTTPDTLPFTGPEDVVLYGLVGLAVAGLGSLLVVSARRENE